MERGHDGQCPRCAHRRTNDLSLERFLAHCARECICCRRCGGGGIPCAGITAGGLCDALCSCDEEYEADRPDCSDPCGDDGYDSDYEDQP